MWSQFEHKWADNMSH